MSPETTQNGENFVDRILARPRLSTVTPGAKVTYECSTRIVAGASGLDTKYQWYYYYDNATAKRYEHPYVVEGPKGTGPNAAVWPEAEWTFPGRHTVKCHVTIPGQTPYYVAYQQKVDVAEAVVGGFLFEQMPKDGKRPKLPHPDTELSTLLRYTETLKVAERKWPSEPGGEKEKAYLKKIEELEEYRDRLTELTEMAPDRIRLPIHVAHVATENQQKTLLRVYVACVSQVGEVPQRWRVVDWTNPTRRELRGSFEGHGATAAEAISHAIELWKGGANKYEYSFGGNRYYPGQVAYVVPKEIAGESISSFFETTGGNDFDTLRKFLTYVAQAAALVAGGLALIMPGSQPLAFAIWASVFSSAASASLNMKQRHDEGFSSWKEDVTDTLTVVTSILGAASWARGAKLICQTGGGQLAKVILVGEITADSLQGVLIAEERYQEYESIVNNKSLSSEERTKEMLKLFAQLAADGAITYVSVKGTADDLKRLRAGQTKHTLQDLKNPNKTIDTTEPLHVEGHTKNGEVKTKVFDQPLRAEEKPVATPPKYKPAPHPSKRGMRVFDHGGFVAASAEDKLIIIVRDSSQHAIAHLGKYKIKAKPEAVKAKTRKTPPNVGLAAADPNDAALKAMLEKKGVTFPEYVEMLEAEGFRVAGKDEGYILRDQDGYAFTSDYDLHGVYKQGSGKDAYNEKFKEKMNDYFLDENVQHGPHDKWTDRCDYALAGPNYGPQPPVTAYMPDGSIVHLTTVAEMKQFYVANNIDWNKIYGKIDWQKYKQMQERMGNTVVLPED